MEADESERKRTSERKVVARQVSKSKSTIDILIANPFGMTCSILSPMNVPKHREEECISLV